jgi:hypothetical protein
MGKSTARKNYTTPIKAAANMRRVHVNDPARRPAPSHDTVRRSTRAKNAAKQQLLNDTFPDAEAKAQKLATPKAIDQWGNPLTTQPETYDNGAEAPLL